MREKLHYIKRTPADLQSGEMALLPSSAACAEAQG